jgi:hypothetical protein
MLATLLVFGPGRLSLDALLVGARPRGSTASA